MKLVASEAWRHGPKLVLRNRYSMCVPYKIKREVNYSMSILPYDYFSNNILKCLYDVLIQYTYRSVHAHSNLYG